MVTDTQTWLAECAAQLMLHHIGSPRCGEEDVLTEEIAKQLAGELAEDPTYSGFSPAQAAERFIRECA